MIDIQQRLRYYGEYLTPIDIFNKFIFPEIKDILYQYIWTDLYAGKGKRKIEGRKYIIALMKVSQLRMLALR